LVVPIVLFLHIYLLSAVSSVFLSQRHPHHHDLHSFPTRRSSDLSRPYSCTPEKDMKPSDIRPMVMKVMPRPCSPSGTSLYLSFSRMPASSAMASAQEKPEPTP